MVIFMFWFFALFFFFSGLGFFLLPVDISRGLENAAMLNNG